MTGLVANAAIIYILYQYWKSRLIEPKWKIILTVLLVFFRFTPLGMISIVLSSLIPIIRIIMLRWQGSRIR